MTGTTELEGTPVTAEPTLVIFRLWPASRGGGVIALFPCEPGLVDAPWMCSSFEHVGQHGAADLGALMNATQPATPEQYAELKRELESAPYSYVLDVRQKSPASASRLRARKGGKL